MDNYLQAEEAEDQDDVHLQQQEKGQEERIEHGATRATDALGAGGSDQTHGQHGQHGYGQHGQYEVMIGTQANQCSGMLQVNLSQEKEENQFNI